jgi:hypothetical protein
MDPGSPKPAHCRHFVDLPPSPVPVSVAGMGQRRTTPTDRQRQHRDRPPAADGCTARAGGGPVHLRDLFAQRLDLFCWCLRCDRHARVAVRSLIDRLGPDIALAVAATRLRCSGCGARGAEVRPAWPPVGQIAGHAPLPAPAAAPGAPGPEGRAFTGP